MMPLAVASVRISSGCATRTAHVLKTCASWSPQPDRARSLRAGPNLKLCRRADSGHSHSHGSADWFGQVKLPNYKLSRHHWYADSDRGRRRGGSCRLKMELRFLAAASRVIRRRAAARRGVGGRPSHEADANVTGRHRPARGQSRGMEAPGYPSISRYLAGCRFSRCRVTVKFRSESVWTVTVAAARELELELAGRSSGSGTLRLRVGVLSCT